MTHEWEIAIQETVGKDRQIALPAPVREAVEGENDVRQPSVFWSYEQNAHFAVLSQDHLSRDNYHGARYTRIYHPNDSSEKRNIRPPKELDNVLPGHFAEGTDVFYLAYDEMVDSDNGTVYLLTASQVLTLLPDAAKADGVRDAVLQTPGFLPSI